MGIRKYLLPAALSVLMLPALLRPAGALDVKREVLPNGLTVIQAERHNLPLVVINLLVKASPLEEPREKAGLAGMTASLLTDGTKTRSASAISNEVDYLGASLVAGTNYDYTTVTLTVLKKNIEKGFSIFSDAVVNPALPEAELRRQKARKKGELKQDEEEPSFVAEKAFRKAVYGDEAYGRLVAGNPAAIDAITRADVVKFHSDYYVPNNAILTVAGDLTPAELKGLIGRYLSPWREKPVPERPVSMKAEPNKKETILIDRDLTQANMVLGYQGISRSSPDFYAASVMNYIFGGGGFASRLMENIRQKRGLAYDVHSFFTVNVYPGLFEVVVQTKNKSAGEVLGQIKSTMEGMRAGLVEKGELEDAKAYLTGSFPLRLDTTRKIAEFLGAAEFYGLGNDFIGKYPGYINRVTAEEVLDAARKYLHPDNYVLVVVAKQSEARIKAK